MTTVKKFLYHVRKDTRRYGILCERAAYLRASCLPGDMPYEKSPVQTSAPGDKTADALSKLVDLEARISAQIGRIRRHRAAAKALVARLSNDTQREALRLYFIDIVRDGTFTRPLTFDEACGEMGLSPESFKKHRNNGIAALQRMIENAPII